MIWMPGYKYFPSTQEVLDNNYSLLFRGGDAEYNADYDRWDFSDAGCVMNRTSPNPNNYKKFTFSLWVKFDSSLDVAEFIIGAMNESAYQAFLGDKIVVAAQKGVGIETHRLSVTLNSTHFDIGNDIEIEYVTDFTWEFLEESDLWGWHHIVINIDTTAPSADDRVASFRNGVLGIMHITNDTPIPQNWELFFARNTMLNASPFLPSKGDKLVNDFAMFVDAVIPSSSLSANGLPKDLSNLFSHADDCWLRFETGQLSTIGVDYSGNNNDFSEYLDAIGLGIGGPPPQSIPFQSSDIKEETP